MVHIAIPDDLFASIKEAAPASMPPEDYVAEVLRQNLEMEGLKKKALGTLGDIFNKAESHAVQVGITDEDIDAVVEASMEQERGRK